MRITALAALTTTALICTAAPAPAASQVSAADRAAITRAIDAALTSGDIKQVCAAYTPTMFRRLYGSTKPCRTTGTRVTGGAPIQVAVYSVSVAGKNATAKVTVQGGDGGTGTFDLTKSTHWQVSLIHANYWRSAFAHVYGPHYKSQGAKLDPFDNKAYRACGLKALLNRSDKEFLTLFYGYRLGHNTAFGKAFSTCAKKAPGGKSPFRVLYETSLRKGMKKGGASSDFQSCVITKMRSAVPAATLINTMMDGTESAAWQKLNKELDTWGAACGRGGGSGKIRAPRGIVRPPVR
jgi:hypothetical protein